MLTAPWPTSQEATQLSNTVGLRFSEGPRLQGIRQEAMEKDTDGCPARSLCAQVHTLICVYYHQREGFGRKERKRKEGENEYDLLVEERNDGTEKAQEKKHTDQVCADKISNGPKELSMSSH